MPAVALVLLGLVVLVGIVASGLFSTVAGGQQMIDELAPHVTVDALDRYDADVATLGSGADAVRAAGVPAGDFPGIERWLDQESAIDTRATDLLALVRAAEPDYQEAASISGFDRVPLLVAAVALAAVATGIALARRARTGAVVPQLLLSALLVAYPFLGHLWTGASSTSAVLESFEPVMTQSEVRALQQDFVVLVHAVGELDTGYRATPEAAAAGPEVKRLVEQWPAVSSDLAELVGTVNDNLDRYAALSSLPAFTIVPWVLVALGLLTASLAVAALPRRVLP